MIGRHGVVILFFVLLINHIITRQPPHVDTSDILAQLNIDSSNPLIVYVNTMQSKTAQESEFDDLFITGDDGLTMNDEDLVHETEAKDQAKHLLYNYLLLKESSTDSLDPDDPRTALRQAIRNRCQAVVECKSSCPPKEKKYCMPNCKAVFDKLDLCYPSKEQTTMTKDPCAKSSDECEPTKDACSESSDECGTKPQAWGKTMPPKW